MDKEKVLSSWLDERARYNDIPRMSDVVEHVKKMDLDLTKKNIRQIMEKHNLFKMNVRQQRPPHRTKSYRPILVSSLGHWHADIGYFSINKRYQTPTSYRAGFLVAKDILSRYTYTTPLIKNKSADSIIKAFSVLFEEHKLLHPGTAIKSIAFDRETSVLSKKVQQFLSDKGIKFFAFEMSSSKAKFAEGAIRLIREKMAILMRLNRKEDRWWNLLPVCTDMLNRQEIHVDGKKLGFSPMNVNEKNVQQFINALQKAAPAYFFAQFDIAPDLVTFKFQKGIFVRAKLIVTTSETVGIKRSEENVTPELFVVEKQIPFVTRNMKIGRAYKCRNIETDSIEIFEEGDLVESSRDGNMLFRAETVQPTVMSLRSGQKRV